MSDLRNYLQNQMMLISSQMAPLLARQAELQHEMNEVSQRLQYFQEEYSDIYLASKAIGLDGPAKNNKPELKKGPPPTIKQAVREVLSQSPGGLTSGQILEKINTRYFNDKMERTSLSPQLSRLRRDGEADLSGAIWTLTEAGSEKAIFNAPLFDAGSEQDEPKENEPDDVSPSSGSDAASIFD